VSPPGRAGFLRAFALYGVSRAGAEGFLSVRGLVLASLLGPEAFGVWALFRIAMQWASFGSFGVLRGLEMAVAQGPGGERAGPAARNALGFLLVAFGILSAATLVASFAGPFARHATWLRAVAAVLVAENVGILGLVVIRARGDLRRYGLSEAALAATHLVLAGSLAWRWHLPGAFVGYAIAAVVGLAWLLRGLPFRPRLDGPVLRSLLATGFPLGLSLMLGTALATADRLVVGAVGGSRALGPYAFGVAVAGLGGSLAWVIRTIVFPGVYREAADEGAAVALTSHFRKKILPLAWTLPIALGAAAVVVAPAVTWILPAYAEAAPVARWMVLTGVTATLTSLATVGATAARRQRAVPAFTATALAVNVALSYALLKSGRGFEAVAQGALLARTLNSAAVLGHVAGAAGLPRARTIAAAMFPLVWCAGAVLLAARVSPGADARAAALALAVYVAALAPILPRVVRLARS